MGKNMLIIIPLSQRLWKIEALKNMSLVEEKGGSSMSPNTTYEDENFGGVPKYPTYKINFHIIPCNQYKLGALFKNIAVQVLAVLGYTHTCHSIS
ncbi:hypothetical protein Zmor_012020 [Zophobas morio]|jgi:hypothetical protein|uniref:Uncharacterized protein n=1 Tax=Zophobas morio TaxID=2755281 RepID=A0AA38HH19_9CUCU|nr:hypothetical protein Zmor_012020 [Zophobas morio]